MRTSTAIIAAVGITVLTSLAPAMAQSTADVDVRDNSFAAANVTVDVGGTVQWTQTGSNPHTITASDGSFDSSPDCPPDFALCLSTGDTFSQSFTQAGTYTYFCKVHGAADGSGMAGTVTVVAADQDPTPSPTATEPATATVSGALTVVDQTGSGSSVKVDSVTVQGAAGFVVIHADGGGRPGAVIGHVAIPEGTSTSVTVPLDTPLTASATIYPMLHLDAGVLGSYEFPGADGPVMDASGVITFPIAYGVAAASQSPELAATGVAGDALARTAALMLAIGALSMWATRRRMSRLHRREF